MAMMTDTRLAPPVHLGALHWIRRRLFATWIDSLITLAFGALVVWGLWQVLDWALVDTVLEAESGAACREVNGACWAVINARGRLILFGLYPYEEHWRSALACLAIIVVAVCSCVPWFWRISRLAPLWGLGFGIFLALMYGGFLGLEVVTTERWGGLSLTVLLFASAIVFGMPLAIL